jgi:superoxide dismutase, Fe-Mn family
MHRARARVLIGRIRAMPFTVPPLPYPYDALEPHIDAQTMTLHHDKHHAAYVANLNAAVDKHLGELGDRSVEDLIKDLDHVPEDVRLAVRNNGGGHLNHSMFWTIMKPKGGGEPTGALADAIKAAFGAFETFQTQFNETGVKQFGSGWVWLAHAPGSGLRIVSTPNQDNPMSQGLYPIMGNDVWEHAYYLKYQNRRADYLKAWWNVVDWDAVSKRFPHGRA